MAEDISAFLKKNVEDVIKVKEVNIKRFSKPFKIKSLTEDEVTNLRKIATVKTVNRRTGQTTTSTDDDRFSSLIVAKSVVYPDLDNAELQTDYGTPGDPEKLLGKMLRSGEYNKLAEAVMEASDLGESTDDLVEKTKN